VKKILHWDGSPDKINLIYNKLKSFDGWEIKRTGFKDKGYRCYYEIRKEECEVTIE